MATSSVIEHWEFSCPQPNDANPARLVESVNEDVEVYVKHDDLGTEFTIALDDVQSIASVENRSEWSVGNVGNLDNNPIKAELNDLNLPNRYCCPMCMHFVNSPQFTTICDNVQPHFLL